MRGLGGLDGLGWGASGVPTESEVLDLYCSLTGRDVAAEAVTWPFHKAFWLYKYAIIAQGVGARAARGVASSASAAAVGAMAPFLMAMAEELMESVSGGVGAGSTPDGASDSYLVGSSSGHGARGSDGSTGTTANIRMEWPRL